MKTEFEYNEESIAGHIHTKWAGHPVHFAMETDSTNEWAKRQVREGAQNGTLYVAEFQNAGKGRLGRSWVAPVGSNIAMSLLLRPEFPPQSASMLTLVMGLTLAQVIRDLGLDASIKWPNDVVLSHKKISGTLTEMELADGKIREVVIGTGINVNLTEIAPELSDKATSLYLESGKFYDRSRMIGLILKQFEINYEKFLETSNLKLLVDDYNQVLANYHQPVRVLDPFQPYEGIAHGINESGELLVEKADGRIETVYAGEVSVRGLYSYS